MQRTLVIAASAPVPSGNRVEISESGDGVVVAVRDLDRGIVFRVRDTQREAVDVWRGVVRTCSVAESPRGAHTTLSVATAAAMSDAEHALTEADAAAAAAKAESDRWGGGASRPAETPERFW